MTLLTTDTSNHVTTLTLNRPDTMNPLGAKGEGEGGDVVGGVDGE